MYKFLLLLILLPTIVFSQITIEVGFDPKMAFEGAYDYDTTPSLDVTVYPAYKFSKFMKVGVNLEYADIDYFGAGLRTIPMLFITA